MAGVDDGIQGFPPVLESVQVGDKVGFDPKLNGSTGEVTAIQKPP